MGSIIGAIAGPILGGIFGGGSSSSSKALETPPFIGASGGGLTSTLTGKKGNQSVSINSSPLRQGLVGQIASTFPEQAKALAGLRASVAPGVSALRSSRLAELENARRASIGNLRENLGRRRVLGSSFAQDALTRSNLDFAQQADKIAADSFLQELQLTQDLTQQEFEARRGEFKTALDELNIQADMATSLATGATSQMGENARLKAQLDAREAAASGKFFGGLGDKIGAALGGLGSGGTVLSGAGAGIY